MFVSSLKVDYIRNRQNYTETLQEIATHIPTTKSQPLSPTRVSKMNSIEGSGGNRFGGDRPAFGAHLADSTIYTGSYPYKKCISKEVVLHHDTIRENRKQ